MNLNKTKIEYLDYTVNLIVGCSGIGCAVRKKCWAMRMAKRKKHKCSLCYTFTPHFHLERMNEPLELKKPSRIGLNFMGETFDTAFLNVESITYYSEMLWMIEKAPQHMFLILTKQPQNIPDSLVFPDNVWLGVTVNRTADLWRIEELKKKKAKVKFVSFEPLYENLGNIDFKCIHWIIIGAQTRPTFLPMPQWIDSIVEQAKQRQIPIFFKDNLPLGYPNKIGEEFPKVVEGV